MPVLFLLDRLLQRMLPLGRMIPAAILIKKQKNLLKQFHFQNCNNQLYTK